ASWLWDFGDTTATSTLQNPTHTYSHYGVHRARLKAFGMVMQCSNTDSSYVDLIPSNIQKILSTQISVFQNYSANEININSSFEISSVCIASIIGEKVYFSSSSGNKAEINISCLPVG